MNLVFYTHPDFLGLQSQQRFVRMLAEACVARGHQVQVRKPQARVHGWVPRGRWSKWAGYVDQFVVFPWELRRRLAHDAADTLHVFCDQALGPWMPAVVRRPHVVHCLDLLALRSALGLIPENPTSFSGRVYQRWIRAGFRQARHFISISAQSRADLHRYGGVQALSSEVVPLGLNHPYRALPAAEARQVLQLRGHTPPAGGLLLHVGGGQWYKNAGGVLALYARYVQRRQAEGGAVLPLWMVSPPPDARLQAALAAVPAPGQVRFVQGVDNEALCALYSLAAALLFPSLAEGYGWPIAEGLACGCPVITTGEPPMNEVGGPHAHYLPRLAGPGDLPAWAAQGATLLCGVLDRPEAERAAARESAIAWARRYDSSLAIERYLDIYARVLAAPSG